MPRRCSVKDCKSKGEKATFHGIPSSLKRQEKWKKALKPFLEDKMDEETKICSKHFKKADYVPSLTGDKTVLSKNAIPSIFQVSMPKKQQEVVVRPRHQSRRAASKEALKQMQILLEDENDAVEIPDDDDEVIPIPVVVAPPKKKYKLTHRKSSDGNDREVLVLKSITPNITNHYVENNLELECWVEELEPCQKERNKKLAEEEKELQSKLDELIKACNGEIVYKGDLTTVIEVSEHVQKTIQAVQASQKKQPIVLNNAVANPQPGYQLVMDPRLGLIVGAVASGNQTPTQQGKIQVASNLQAPVTPTNQASAATNRRSRTKKQTPVAQPTPPPQTTPISTRSTPASKFTTRPAAPAPISTRSSPSPITTRSLLNSNNKQSNKRAAPPPPPAAPPATRSRRDPAGAVVNARPTETSVEGGLTTGTSAKPKAIVDLTSDDGRPLPDSREISFNKLQGKTFPSLVVVARPHLRVTDVNSDRPKLDAKVKSVLMYAPTKFTEWLIQQGLVKSEQKCSIHTSTQLKLGMYSDVSKFPYSGGYVWISECCPQRFVSVFSGSVFEGSPHPPLVILKILYHWCCQTNIQNVTQWVKVDNLYVKGMYTWLRSICTVALQSHIRQLGGPQTKVEVGVISLGTTSQDGNSRQVKVEVLGILETPSKLIRLRAIEPLADGDRNYKKRFSKILEPLGQWVHPSSIIVTDLTVDKATLHQMGFSTVIQTTSVDANNSNRTIMEYLRRIVPRMFQNTLSLLSRQIIQQFLDELVWREWFGITSMQAFDNLISHLAEQTRCESNQSLIVKLNRVALNPFKNWSVPATTTTTAPVAIQSPKPADPATKKRKRKEPEPPKPAPPKPAPPKPAPTPTIDVSRPPKSTSPDVPEQMVPLENYYYGTIDNYPPKTNVTLNMKCPFCKDTFNNNIILMNHLFKHAHNVSQDGQMCRYCLTSVPTANDLLKHIATAHPSETKHDNGFVCLICETQYMNPFVLGKHMSKEHRPSELPYQCGTCGYKCSNHKQAIDHFYKQHDNGPTIQCPFCLKSTTVFSSSRNLTQNVHYFIQHLQKHQRKQFARRCGKCNLWFVQKDILKDHQNKMHTSQRGKTGLIPWIAPRNGVMVPKSKMDKYPCDAEGINFTTLFYNVTKNLKCKECDGQMDTPKHFPSFESCQNPNCQYSTCCTNAMQEHNAKCNKNSQHVVPEEKLPYEMFCICGYSSRDGNQLAKHLAVCEKKSAYPSLSDAKSASVTHSMLDVLGLVRKPEETEKKQTAFTRNYKKVVAKSEPDPETITLEDDPPKNNDFKSTQKKSKLKSKSEHETKPLDIDIVNKSGKEDISKGCENKKVDEGNKSDEVSKNIEAEKEPETVEKNAETLEKNVNETQEKDSEPKVIAKNCEPEVIEKNTKPEFIEKDSEPKVVERDLEPEFIEKDSEPEVVERDSELVLEKASEPEVIEKDSETEIIEKDSESEVTEKDSECDITDKDSESKILEKDSKSLRQDTVNKDDSDVNEVISDSVECTESASSEQKSSSVDESSNIKSLPESAVTKLSSLETEDDGESQDNEVRQIKTLESELESNKESMSITESNEENKTEAVLSDEIELKPSQNVDDETNKTDDIEIQPKRYNSDNELSNSNEATKNSEPCDDKHSETVTKNLDANSEVDNSGEGTEVTKQSEDVQNLPQEYKDQSLNEKVFASQDKSLEIKAYTQDQNASVSEDISENTTDKIEDMMRLISDEANKNLEQDASSSKSEPDPSNKFENITNKDENLLLLSEDPPSAQSGVYDDISESSDNVISKYMDDAETTLNMGETETPTSMEGEAAESSRSVLEPMDYEEISNTGLDTPTSMDTD